MASCCAASNRVVGRASSIGWVREVGEVSEQSEALVEIEALERWLEEVADDLDGGVWVGVGDEAECSSEALTGWCHGAGLQRAAMRVMGRPGLSVFRCGSPQQQRAAALAGLAGSGV